MRNLASTTGQRIWALRHDLGLTQEELGQKLKVTKAAVNRYEKDRLGQIPRGRILQLAEIFDVSPAYLMGWTDKKDDYVTDKPAEPKAQEPERVMPRFQSLIEGTGSPEENFILEIFRKSSVQQRLRIMNYFMALSEGKDL